MIIAVMQPTFIPWLGYFDMIDKVDLFIYYDDVQLEKRSWQVRNKLKNTNGEFWLNVPISKTKSRNETFINNAEINYNENWIKNKIKSIEFSYKKSPYFEEVFPFICSVFKEYNLLADFNINMIENIKDKIGITTKTIRSSKILDINGNKDNRLVEIIKKLGFKNYLSSPGSINYINRYSKGGAFVKNDIELYYNNYEHPIYKQLNNDFIPYLGVFDLLFNEGFNNSLKIIVSGRKNNIHYNNI